MKCPFNKQNNLPPCLPLHNKKWGYLKNFLQNDYKNEDYISIIPILKCLNIVDGHIKIDQSKCIKCLFCVSNCPENLISIGEDFILTEKCSEFDGKIEIEIGIVDKFFKGELIEIPYLKKLSNQNKYKTLEDFAKVNETQNIAIWGASLIKFLSSDPKCRLGLEIKMIIESRDRGGRLDICLFSHDEYLFAAETKVSFRKMMQENRYVSQMIGYKEEIKNNLKSLDLEKIKNFEFLLVDDKESDLLFSSHPKCTSKVGNQANLFYQNLVEHNLFFISATALWAVMLKKLIIDKEKYSLEHVLSEIMIDNCYGLTSAGVIKKEQDSFVIIELDTYL
jgi:ferredoxin